jgi:predicted AlkP superfamily pyrophosphatase or phosphodiesterase
VESGPDNVPYEGLINGEQAPVFPHKLPELWDANGGFGLLRITPFGNSLTTDFALEALNSEALGADDVPDFLAISYSSTDYVGHFYGVDSKEVEDTYLRLDLELARLLKQLDKKVGYGNYTVFLTADHGALPVAGYLADQNLPAGNLELQGMRTRLNEFLQYTYGDVKLVRNISNNQIFLDHDLIRNLDLSLAEVQSTLAAELMSYDAIEAVYTATQMMQADYTEGVPAILQQGFNPKRSGDLLLVHPRGYVSYPPTGSTHGSPYPYDTHVPLLFFGKGIRHGNLLRRTTIPDIAPTVAALLGIALPDGTTGEPIPEVLE